MNTIIDLFERSCDLFPDNPYLWEKRNGVYVATTYRNAHNTVIPVAAGLLTFGLEKGERVAILSEGCTDWVCCELGILYAGGVSVPLSIKLTERELSFRINHSGARFIAVSPYYLQIIEKIRPSIPGIEEIFVLNTHTPQKGDANSFEYLWERGVAWCIAGHTHTAKLEEIYKSVVAEDPASISYTSGTTAEPKGIILTHGNYVSNVLQADSLIQIPENYKILLFLPWDHAFAHTVGIYSFMYNGASVAAVDFGSSPMEYLRNIPQNLKEVKPHMLLSVPSIAKNFRKNIEAEIKKKGRFTQLLYKIGLKTAYAYYGKGNTEKKGIRMALFPLTCLFDLLVFSRIRNSFGRKLQFFIGGGALLDTELQRYYCALGIPMYQGYGLSEASPVISTNTPELHKFGSSGKLVQPMDLRICDENGQTLPQGQAGEIVIRGGNVMKGYWENEESTRNTIRDNWLYTGDLGFLDSQDFLHVQGRFKSLLIATDGEKYSPEGIEEAIVEQSPYIDYCILYNNQSPYTIGLIVPNKQALKEYVNRKGVETESVESYKLMLDKIHKELMAYRYGGPLENLFPERWLPAVVSILPELLNEQNATINSTSKIVRNKILQRFHEEIKYAYTPEGKDITNTRNTQNIKHLIENN